MNDNYQNLPFAQDANYWRTGKTSPDVKMDQVAMMITEAGGEVTGVMQGHQDGHAGICINFLIDDHPYRIAWPILPIDLKRDSNPAAARIQTATFIFHEVKAIVVKAQVMGLSTACVPYLLLKNGRTVAESSSAQIESNLPATLLAAPVAG